MKYKKISHVRTGSVFMKFSILIPTRNRLLTAKQAIVSCLNSRYSDMEIVVGDNSDTEELRDFVEGCRDKRIRYFSHDIILSMKENWEFCVSKSSGDYVAVIGDDDALMPDGLLFANEILSKFEPPILHCNVPEYKWPDYPFIPRRNLLTVPLPTQVRIIPDPSKYLLEAYSFQRDVGTGPGIYRGLVSRSFLEKLKNKRGAYFLNDNPDFDSGYSTLLYAENYMMSSYPIFLSGHSGSSNSGSMRVSALQRKSLAKFCTENSSQAADHLISGATDLVTTGAGIIREMVEFLDEIRQVRPDLKLELNKQAAFNYICGKFEISYENTTYEDDRAALSKLAEAWDVSAEKIPSHKQLTVGKLIDTGVNRNSVGKDEPVKDISIDCNMFNVQGILDVIPIVEAMTIDWRVVLAELNIFDNETVVAQMKKTAPGFDEKQKWAVNLINEGRVADGIQALEQLIYENPMAPSVSYFLGIVHYNSGDFIKAIPHLSRSLSLCFDLQTFKAYFQALIKEQLFDTARSVCRNYKISLNELTPQLFDHYVGLVEMNSGDFSKAQSIFSKIEDPFDVTLVSYCKANQLYKSGKYPEALSSISAALELKEDDEAYQSLYELISGKSR